MRQQQPIYKARKSRGKTSSPLGTLIILIVIGAIISGSIFYSRYTAALKTPRDAQVSQAKSRAFTINAGESSSKIISRLYEEDFIASPSYIKWYIWRNDLGNKVQKGSYSLSPNMTPLEIIKVISGEVSQDRWVTIPEGWRLSQIADRLEANHIGTKQEFYNLTRTAPDDFKFKNEIPEGKDIEGYMFPDSYKISNGADAQEIISKALNNFEHKMTQERLSKIEQSRHSFHEIITLASLIEREAKTRDDKFMIAGVIENRLKSDMRLDIDATTGYAINDWKLDLDKKELDTDSPYNTRKYKGIPPGPISTVSADAIDAILSPNSHDYLYYISDQNGKIIYAKTLSGHNANVQKYLR